VLALLVALIAVALIAVALIAAARSAVRTGTNWLSRISPFASSSPFSGAELQRPAPADVT
jgi:hypothetical protein